MNYKGLSRLSIILELQGIGVRRRVYTVRGIEALLVDNLVSDSRRFL